MLSWEKQKNKNWRRRRHPRVKKGGRRADFIQNEMIFSRSENCVTEGARRAPLVTLFKLNVLEKSWLSYNNDAEGVILGSKWVPKGHLSPKTIWCFRQAKNMQQRVPERLSLGFPIKLPVLEKITAMSMTPKASSYGQDWCPKDTLGFQKIVLCEAWQMNPLPKRLQWEIWGIMT